MPFMQYDQIEHLPEGYLTAVEVLNIVNNPEIWQENGVKMLSEHTFNEDDESTSATVYRILGKDYHVTWGETPIVKPDIL